MIAFVTMIEKYGPIRRYERKHIVARGRDFYTLKVRGKNFHVPKCVCHLGDLHVATPQETDR